MVIGFFLAMLVKREARGVGFARALIYYPNIAPTIGFATVWTYLLTPTVGFISQVAKMMGVTAPDFLNDPQYAIYTIMVVYLWREAGFVMIFYTSGLQNISPEYYEAALIDGASPFTMLRKITLPLVRPTTVFVLMCTMANSFKMVDLIVTMTTKGGPNNSTNVLMYHIYQTAFAYWDIGKASVMTVVMLVFMLHGILCAVWAGRTVTPTTTTDRRRKAMKQKPGIATRAVLLVVSLLWAIPLIWSVLTALKPSKDPCCCSCPAHLRWKTFKLYLTLRRFCSTD